MTIAERAQPGAPADLRSYFVEERLRDGTHILIRTIRPDDKERLKDHFEALSARSVYLRFMGTRRTLTDADLVHLTELDLTNHVGLAGTIVEGGRERFIGIGRYFRAENATRAEVAFAVLDDYQGRGIGTLLLEHLSRIAGRNRILEFEAYVLGENRQMLDVFAQSGFKVRRTFDSGAVHLYLVISDLKRMRLLAFNCGSSSLKFKLIELDDLRRERNVLARGLFQELGPKSTFEFFDRTEVAERGARPIRDHAEAALAAIGWMRAHAAEFARLDAVVHRVVHGGNEIVKPSPADDETLDALERATEFAPLHNPPAIATIRAVAAELTGVAQFVVTDTAFHATLPPMSRTYAIPRELAERHGIRRFGFHGIGHAWMMERYAEISHARLEQLNLITLQLGAGCSITAIRGGRSYDTSMGLTPLEGLVMATRSGDLDPAIITRLSEREGKSPGEIERILNHESGLLGVSGLSDDLRELRKAELEGNPHATLAIEIFCYRIRKYIGAYLAALGNVDAIIFSAGIGEHADFVRKRVLSGLESMGIVLDLARNRAANGREAEISAPSSRIRVWVIPLDEEVQMARAAAALLQSRGGAESSSGAD